MIYSFLADLLVVFHLVFIIYVMAGALLIFKWPKTLWLHLPACFWGMTVEFTGWICPLTPWEIQHGTGRNRPYRQSQSVYSDSDKKEK